MDVASGLAASIRMPVLALLVDRDAETRRMYTEYLRRAACATDEAEDGREALVKALTHQPDIIVTETRLPGINGLELCRLLRQDNATRTTPIIVVTGDGLDENVRRAAAAGADAVLVKPCLPEALFAEMARVLSLSVALREHARDLREKATEQLARADALIKRSNANQRRTIMSRAYNRRDTAEPPLAPPTLVCPECDVPLQYQRSYIGGVSERHAEQWDCYECTGGCGGFQYRQRTRKLRRI